MWTTWSWKTCPLTPIIVVGVINVIHSSVKHNSRKKKKTLLILSSFPLLDWCLKSHLNINLRDPSDVYSFTPCHFRQQLRVSSAQWTLPWPGHVLRVLHVCRGLVTQEHVSDRTHVQLPDQPVRLGGQRGLQHQQGLLPCATVITILAQKDKNIFCGPK